jgi:hypothetical protein
VRRERILIPFEADAGMFAGNFSFSRQGRMDNLLKDHS